MIAPVSSSSGLIIAGELVPGTDWIRRDPSAWWRCGERGTRRRADTIDLLVGHWTGGEATLRSYDDDGPHVVRSMKGRKRADGRPLNVGIHFVIGACDHEDEIAPVWQTADPGEVATVHVGQGWINARSIGVEVVSAGRPGPADVRSRPRLAVPLLGKAETVLAFYPGQLRAWVRLAETLAALDGRGGICIPRHVPETLACRRFTVPEAKRWRGAMEHLHCPGTTKRDAGGLLVEALLDAGWEAVRP